MKSKPFFKFFEGDLSTRNNYDKVSLKVRRLAGPIRRKRVNPMESGSFRSVAFGGFDKQDVASYIEKISAEHAEALNTMKGERDSLQARCDSQAEQLTSLSARNAEQSAELEQLRAEAERLRPENSGLREQLQQTEQRAQEAETLRPDAEAYREFRNRIGDIECESRKRAAELENSTCAKLDRVIADFRAKYQGLTATFQSTSGYVTGELRKVEVNLTQLPRALDQIGVELDKLENTLHETDSK